MLATTKKHTCKNCGHTFIGKFCNSCGEKVYTENDRKIIHFFEQAFHFITHFEGTFFTTLKTMFTKPGQLSLDYCHGIRKKYFKPIPLYLLLVVLYLIFPFFKGLNMSMKFYKNEHFYGSYATKTIEKVQAKTGYSIEELSEKFHTKGEKVSKFLLFILIPISAIFFYILTFKIRKYFFDSFVIAAEINSFYLLWGFFGVPLFGAIAILIGKLFNRTIYIDDVVIGPSIYLVLCTYIAIALQKFYSLKQWKSYLISILFAVVHILTVYILYKFLLFNLVIYQIS